MMAINWKKLFGNLSNCVYTLLLPVFLSGLAGFYIKNQYVMLGITAGLAAIIGAVKLSGILPRLIIAHNKRYVERHINKALKRLEKMAHSRRSGVYNYALCRMKTIITPKEYIAFLTAAAKDGPDEDKQFYFQQLKIQEELHEKH